MKHLIIYLDELVKNLDSVKNEKDDEYLLKSSLNNYYTSTEINEKFVTKPGNATYFVDREHEKCSNGE